MLRNSCMVLRIFKIVILTFLSVWMRISAFQTIKKTENKEIAEQKIKNCFLMCLGSIITIFEKSFVFSYYLSFLQQHETIRYYNIGLTIDE